MDVKTATEADKDVSSITVPEGYEAVKNNATSRANPRTGKIGHLLVQGH